MNSREKGKRGERRWRDELRANGYAARRGQQFSGSADSPDVVCSDLAWVHFEVKAVEKLNLEDAMEQARRDCGAKAPVVAHKRSHRGWLVTMGAETFFQFLRGTLPPESITTEQHKKTKMKIKLSNSNFEPCPEYTGRAVCVDVTPLKKQQSQFGEREVFKLVFEIMIEREDGSRFCAWSRNFTPSLNEKANLRKFLRAWFGRDLTKQEMAEFDTESLIGKTAQLVVVHDHKDGETYANIVACTPDRSAEPLKPSGNYVRVKDRPPKDGGATGQNGSYQRAEQPASDGGDLGATKIHVGRCKGLEIRDLAPEQVQGLIENWLPTAKANSKPSADDRRLMAALDWWQANQKPADDDNAPY